MKCHSIDHGTAKRYHVVCKCRYFALNILSGNKTQDFNPRGMTGIPTLFIWESFPPPPPEV